MGGKTNHLPLLVLLCIASIGNAVLIVPAPTVRIESATSTSITLNWTMPINEHYDKVEVKIQPANVKSCPASLPNGCQPCGSFLLSFPNLGTQQPFAPNQTYRVVENLQPGYLYTFLVTAFRQRMRSDVVVINQDTIPLPPRNLALETFDQIELIIESPYFENSQFTLNFPGIEAVWEPPTEGFCDCYEAQISPNDGQMAFPTYGNEHSAGTLVRQFIRLTPGKTYTVMIYSTTCGNGALGALRSDPVMMTITLPPSEPPTIVDSTDTTTTSLTWQQGIIPGMYDDFRVTGLEGNMSVVPPESPQDRHRTITGLHSCTEYSFNVHTLNEHMASRNGRHTAIQTKPAPPMNLQVVEFNSSSMLVTWTKDPLHEVGSYKVTITPPGRTTTVSEPSLMVTGLSPGTMYNISVVSRCHNEFIVSNTPVSITHATVPYVPQACSVQCVSNTPTEVEPSAPQYSVISMLWTPPSEGSWDGFVIDYSPYQFEGGNPTPPSPIVVGRNVFKMNITLPVVGRIITIYIRTKQGNVLSSPSVMDANCPNGDGALIRRCRVETTVETIRWNITVTLIREDTYMLIEIPLHPIRYSLVYYRSNALPLNSLDHSITIRNPCSVYPNAKIVVYPVCPDSTSTECSTVVRRLCTIPLFRPTKPGRPGQRNDPDPGSLSIVLPTQACCSGITYSPLEAKCCHNQLVHEGTANLGCCFTRWYNVSSQTCCGNGRVRSLLNGCS